MQAMSSSCATVIPPTCPKSWSEILPRSQPVIGHSTRAENEIMLRNDAVKAAERAFQKSIRSSDLTVSARTDEASQTSAIAQPRLERLKTKSIRFAGPTSAPPRDYPPLPTDSPNHKVRHHTRSSTQCSAESGTSAVVKLEHFEQDRSDAPEVSTQAPPTQPRPKKISKATSMFSLRKALTQTSRSDFPRAGRHLRRQSVRSSESLGSSWHYGTRDKLFTAHVLKRKSSCGAAKLHRPNDGAAVRLARVQYVSCQDQQLRPDVRTQADPILRGQRMLERMRRPRRHFTSDPLPEEHDVTSQSLEPGPVTIYVSSTRRLAASLMSRLKPKFLRTNHGPVQFPAQQLQSSRKNLNYINTWSGHGPSKWTQRHSLDTGLMHGIGCQGIPTNQASSVSGDEEDYLMSKDKTARHDPDLLDSRIASWSDSTVLGSIKTPLVPERKHLSIIDEDSRDYLRTASSKVDTEYPQYAAFRQPLKIYQRTPQLETQRIFSALQREIERKHSDNTIGEDRSAKYLVSEVSAEDSGECPTSCTEKIPSLLPMATKPSTRVNNSQYQLNTDRRRTSFLRRPLREMRSTFFPANGRIERDRGLSPFRKITKVRSSSDAADHGPGISADAEQSYQASIEDLSVMSINHVATACSNSIYSSSSEVSPSPSPNMTGMPLDTPVETCGVDHKILRQWSNRSEVTSGSVEPIPAIRVRQSLLSPQVTYLDPSTIGNNSPIEEFARSRRLLPDRTLTCGDTEAGQAPENEFACGPRVHGCAYKSSPLNSATDGTKPPPKTRTPLKDITPEGNSEDTKDRLLLTYASPHNGDTSTEPRHRDNQRVTRYQSSKLQKDDFGSTMLPKISEVGSLPSSTGSSSDERPRRSERMDPSSSAGLQWSTSLGTGLTRGVRVGYLPHVDSGGNQLGLAEDSSSSVPSRLVQPVARGLSRSEAHDRAQLVSSFLKDRRRDIRTNSGSGDEAAFI